MGARLELLAQMFAANGFVAPNHSPLALAILLSALARLPFRIPERLRLAQLRRRGPAPGPPLFVIGHWRTGTTHLHNLLACSPAFGIITPLASGLPGEILTLGSWLRPLLERALPHNRGVDAVAVRPDSPQEDEIPVANLQPLSVFHAVYFPNRFQELIRRGVFLDGCSEAEITRWQRSVAAFAEKIALQQGKPLLIKNPVYTGRIALLRAIWPEARFVHIRRNPYEVFASTRRYYRRLLPSLALQDFSHVDLDAFVLETFTGLMRRYDAESCEVAAGRLVEVRYEDLARRPIDVLAEIHTRLHLPEWQRTHPRATAYLRTLRDYRPSHHVLSAAEIRRVDAAWGPYIQRWT